MSDDVRPILPDGWRCPDRPARSVRTTVLRFRTGGHVHCPDVTPRSQSSTRPRAWWVRPSGLVERTRWLFFLCAVCSTISSCARWARWY